MTLPSSARFTVRDVFFEQFFEESSTAERRFVLRLGKLASPLKREFNAIFSSDGFPQAELK